MIKRFYKQLFPEKFRNQLRTSVQQMLAPLYYGSTYACNCCDKSFRKFLSKGYENRQHAQCPNCGSLERTRLLLFYLEKETSIFSENQSVLHIAPESTLFNIFSKLNIEYIDGDINPDYARHVIDLTNIPFDDNYFDLIICSHVLGHIPDEAKAVREMKRVLKPGGQALVLTLLDLSSLKTIEESQYVTPQQKLAAYGEPDLCRLHGMDMADRLGASGLKVEAIDYRKFFNTKTVERYRLGDGRREFIFRCVKEVL